MHFIRDRRIGRAQTDRVASHVKTPGSPRPPPVGVLGNERDRAGRAGALASQVKAKVTPSGASMVTSARRSTPPRTKNRRSRARPRAPWDTDVATSRGISASGCGCSVAFPAWSVARTITSRHPRSQIELEWTTFRFPRRPHRQRHHFALPKPQRLLRRRYFDYVAHAIRGLFRFDTRELERRRRDVDATPAVSVSRTRTAIAGQVFERHLCQAPKAVLICLVDGSPSDRGRRFKPPVETWHRRLRRRRRQAKPGRAKGLVCGSSRERPASRRKSVGENVASTSCGDEKSKVKDVIRSRTATLLQRPARSRGPVRALHLVPSGRVAGCKRCASSTASEKSMACRTTGVPSIASST